MSFRPSRWALSSALVAAWAVSICPFSEAAELDAHQIASRNTAAIDALLPFSCTIEVDNLEESPLGRYTVASYYRSQEATRVNLKLGTMNCDALVKDGRTLRYSADARIPGDGGRIGVVTADTNTLLVDVWNYSLAIHSDGVSFQSRTLGSLVTKSSKLKATPEVVSGRGLVRLDLATDTTDFVFWLDPAFNYLVSRSRGTTKDGKTFESVVEGFSEVAPGVYFPTSCRRTIVKSGAAPTGWVAKFTKVTATKPLPADAFAFRFPPGLLVQDEIANTLKLTDSAGQPNLAPKNARGEPMYTAGGLPPTISLDRSAAVEQAAVPQQATEVEPTPRSRWLLPAGIAFLAVGLTLWLISRVRQNRLEK